MHVRDLDAIATDLAERGAEILEGPVSVKWAASR
jgi:hypothetical protein